MDNLCQEVHECRLCSSKDIEVVLRLPDTPPANRLLFADQLKENEPKFPLQLYLCKECGNVGLKDVINSDYLFKDYLYTTSSSPSLVKHLETYYDHLYEVLELNKRKRTDLIVIPGSNDGTEIIIAQNMGCRAVGVEPSNLAQKCQNEGLTVYNNFFTPEIAEKIVQENGKARVIVANNVFAHLSDYEAFTKAAVRLLEDDGFFVFEVNYLYDLVKNNCFDTIYHEHTNFWSVKPLRKFLRGFGLDIYSIEHNLQQGGSLRVFAQKVKGEYTNWESVEKYIRQEEEFNLFSPALYQNWAMRIYEHGAKLRKMLEDLIVQGKTISAFSWPAKACTLTHTFGIDKNLISFAVEDSKIKQGKFTPGNHIPILNKEEWLKANTNYCVIFAWNYFSSIVERNKEYRGRWINPITLEII